jgi:hypothetical protein
MSKWISVDVEADGDPCPIYSMVSFGAIVVQEDLYSAPTFDGKVAPISNNWIPEALAVSGYSREEHVAFEAPEIVMPRFHEWLKAQAATSVDGRVMLISDNVAFDWQFINYYLHVYAGENIFGWSGRRIGDLYGGMMRSAMTSDRHWKRMAKTTEDHSPLNNARGNAEVLVEFKRLLGLKVPF